MAKKTRLIFLGPPGAGKGTQAQVIAELWSIPHISTGEILRAAIKVETDLGKQAKSFVDQGELVPDHLILDLIKERLGKSDVQNGWILDGFPRNVEQARFLDQLLTEISQSCDYAVNFEVPEPELITRMLGRGRKDDNEETISNRLKVYLEQTAPVIDYYRQQGILKSIDGNCEQEQVTIAVQQVVSNQGDN